MDCWIEKCTHIINKLLFEMYIKNYDLLNNKIYIITQYTNHQWTFLSFTFFERSNVLAVKTLYRYLKNCCTYKQILKLDTTLLRKNKIKLLQNDFGTVCMLLQT